MKIIVILAIVIYLLYKLGSFFYRIGAASQNLRQFHEQKRAESSAKKSADSKIKGGEYIDYEEVK
jgi:hypothetical protein